MTSSPLRAGATLEEELAYYKAQYEQLETDLADFQASSKELEEQLERDVDAAEKSQRKLKAQVEKLGFEVEEWKTKYKQSKAEGNMAQNTLQKEVTGLRDGNRTLQLKLRDIEVANDDYERQARHTTSSLEDMEIKYNVAIERDVLMEEEIKANEQERESLRIETQRLRDELSDLKIEAEITQEKLRLAKAQAGRHHARKPSPLAIQNLRARSPGSEMSGVTPSSPAASTPPAKSDSEGISEAMTPPSPPLSDAPARERAPPQTPIPAPKRRSLGPDSATPRPGLHGPRAVPIHSRGPSVASNVSSATDAKAMKPPARRAGARFSKLPSESLPRSDSLYQIRGLIGRMQKIEERVHSARSKLPAPKETTPRASPRPVSALGSHGSAIPASVTVRRSSKRPSATPSIKNLFDVNHTSDSRSNNEDPAPNTGASRRRESHIKRLSFGIPPPSQPQTSLPTLKDGAASSVPAAPPPPRPASALDRPAPSLSRPASALDRPPSAAEPCSSRPSSRASQGVARPESRSSTRTPLSVYGAVTPGRPRSSMRGSYGSVRGHRPSASASALHGLHAPSGGDGTPSRATALGKSGAVTLAPSGLARPAPSVWRTSSGPGVGGRRSIPGPAGARVEGEMRPPPLRRKGGELGETF